jgi:beta-glucosidase
MRIHLFIVVLVGLASAIPLVAAAPLAADDSLEARIDALLRQMTIEEKVGQLTQHDGGLGDASDVVKRGGLGSLLNVLGAERTNALQHVAVEQSRLHIPLLFGYDVIHGYRTIFPVPIAAAGSFDLALIEQAQAVAAREASAAGIKWTFAPMLDIARDPRWGRIVEGAGEDPYLGSVIAAAGVRGFQGHSLADPQSIAACAKHYVAYGAAEGGRDYNGADISERLLREVYLPPFKAALDAGSATFMSAFESLNGVPATANRHVLTEILRREWGFSGFVVSDYGAVHELVAHGVAADDMEAAARAIVAGLDMDMVDDAFAQSLPQLVASGKVPLEVLDEAVRRVLRVKMRAGLFERPYTDPAREATDILTPSHRELARRLAQESLVLLKNDNDTLPLTRATKTVAVIGPLADDKANQLGPWAGDGRAEDAITPLAALRARLADARVVYAKGVDLVPYAPIVMPGAPAPKSAAGVAGAAPSGEPARLEQAVAAARKADVAIVFVGETADMSGEAASRANLTLPGRQQQLLEAVVATGKRVVLVVESGRPLDMRWASEHVAAIVQAWYPGTEAGHAIADVLSGDAAPSARLPISWPRSIGQIPIYYNHAATGRPSTRDRWHTGYQDEGTVPLYPFGHGLTYTRFHYGELTVQTPTLGAAGTLRVSAEIENAGRRAGTEVVQLYVRDRVGPTSRPVRELKGFSRVSLEPGARQTVAFEVAARDLGSYDTDMTWVVPRGTYDVWIAPNAMEGTHGTFQVD